MSLITVDNLTAQYGERKVLRGVHLQVNEGEILVIVGGSGCGKSTLLRHLVGLSHPVTGSVTVGGRNISKLSESEYREFATTVGMLFQSGALFNSLTIEENIALPLREHTNLSQRSIRLQTRLKLGLVGLSEFANTYPSELSGGMKKRAAIARAIALDPKIIFFDELSAGLDPVIAAGLDNLVLRLRKLLHMTIVVVSHEIGSIFTIADRIALLAQGEIKFVGTPGKIRQSTQEDVVKFFGRKVDDEKNGGPWLQEILVPGGHHSKQP